MFQFNLVLNYLNVQASFSASEFSLMFRAYQVGFNLKLLNSSANDFDKGSYPSTGEFKLLYFESLLNPNLFEVSWVYYTPVAVKYDYPVPYSSALNPPFCFNA